jgi:hypothetical protein
VNGASAEFEHKFVRKPATPVVIEEIMQESARFSRQLMVLQMPGDKLIQPVKNAE